jgi:hypothetical protein
LLGREECSDVGGVDEEILALRHVWVRRDPDNGVIPATDIMFQLAPSLRNRLCWPVVVLVKTLVAA